jgi:hypothetical protein
MAIRIPTETIMAADGMKVQKYKFCNHLEEIIPMIVSGMTNMEIADAICPKLGWGFLTSQEWKIINNLREYMA